MKEKEALSSTISLAFPSWGFKTYQLQLTIQVFTDISDMEGGSEIISNLAENYARYD